MGLKSRMEQREGGGTSPMSTGRKPHVHNGHGSDHPRGSESLPETETWSQRPAGYPESCSGGSRGGQDCLSPVSCPACIHNPFSSSKYIPGGRRGTLWQLWGSSHAGGDPEVVNESDWAPVGSLAITPTDTFCTAPPEAAHPVSLIIMQGPQEEEILLKL